MNIETSWDIPYKSSEKIRQDFLDFYASKSHKIIESAPVVSHEDPSTLFVNSGMMPLKPVFLGQNPHGWVRVCNTQKVLRVSGKHNDLDEVGCDGYHHTFFEMLGHWSFGDYFKKETIGWGWQLITEVYGIPKNRLFATVHHSDEEAYELWLSETDIEPWRLMRFGEDNFWEMGATGPCGTSSELHFDGGDMTTQKQTYDDPLLGVNSESHRYVELINFVFMASEKLPDGSLTPLPQRHIDTGGGLERLCAVIQGVTSNYDTDLFIPLIKHITELSGVAYHADQRGTPHRVISDHIRAVSFGLLDGVGFAPDGRGYVVRRIMRRALRFAHNLGLREPQLHHLVPTLVKVMSGAFPALEKRASEITEAIAGEEERFLSTLSDGLCRLDELLSRLSKKSLKQIPGRDLFALYDTYGFPLDLSASVARERGFSTDEVGYHQAMKEQKERARRAQKFRARKVCGQPGGEFRGRLVFVPGVTGEFCGYDHLEVSQVRTLWAEWRGPSAESAESAEGDHGDERILAVALERTPFYATSGGQLGDRGLLFHDHIRIRVEECEHEGGEIVHFGTVVQGELGDDLSGLATLSARVDQATRHGAAIHHSATHLLHAALRERLGEGISQKGAYCDADGLRFDFSYPRALSDDQLRMIEGDVCDKIAQAVPVTARELPMERARELGAVYLAGESYGDQVRMLTMGEVSNRGEASKGLDQYSTEEHQAEGLSGMVVGNTLSRELCGGTHVRCTGEIGPFVVTSQSSVAAGIRRITALAGARAREYHLARSDELKEVYQSLNVPMSSQGLDRARVDKPISLRKIQELKDQITALKAQNTSLLQEKSRYLIERLWLGAESSDSGAHIVMVMDLSEQLPATQLSAFLEQFCESAHRAGNAAGGARGEVAKQVGDYKGYIAVFWHLSPPELTSNGGSNEGNSGERSGDQGSEGSLLLLTSISKDLQPRWHSGKLVGALCQVWGGRGGGRPDRARGGVKNLPRGQGAQIEQTIREMISVDRPPYKSE